MAAPADPAALPGAGPAAASRIRLDKWLWQAHFFRSRSLAAAAVGVGQVRLNGAHCLKPGHAVGPGDVLTFAQGTRIRVVRIVAAGTRRGPAAEAQGLYGDLDAGKQKD
ncbi:MAG: RNA-binding S4 domain-containing protein [Paracoccaceae bacterium]